MRFSLAKRVRLKTGFSAHRPNVRYLEPVKVSFLENVRIRARLTKGLRRESNGCLVWTGRKNQKSYGLISFQGRRWLIHRLVWTLERGEIPDGLLVCHHCDNPPCAEPDHLFTGTVSENNADMTRKGRRGFASKIEPDDVRKIRRLRRKRMTHRAIADEVGCSKQIVTQVCNRISWKHIKG